MKLKNTVLIFAITSIFFVSGCTATSSMELEEDNILNTDIEAENNSYNIVDTGQVDFYDENGKTLSLMAGFEGQDSSYMGNQPDYTDNGDGTITDNVTGLTWQQGFVKSDFADAEQVAKDSNTGGYDDWRVPTVKELYSLMLFTGNQGSGDPSSATPPSDAVPFIDTNYFDFEYGVNSRYIDAQYITSTEYVSTTMNKSATFFGVNFADGRIKGYPVVRNKMKDTTGAYYLKLVRGNTAYGENEFVDNGDDTITDTATSLMWSKVDSGSEVFDLSEFQNSDGSLDWTEALNFAENIEFAGYDDWRLPNAKELNSIVDYTKSPDTTNSAAINDCFQSTQILNEASQNDYPFYWSSTSFNPGSDAVYFSFGRGFGYFDIGNGEEFIDVHGAGSQRTDPKVGESTYGFGPQGDVRRVYNYVRLVRDTDSITKETSIEDEKVAENTQVKEKTMATSDYELSVITVGTGTPIYDENKACASTMIQYNGEYILVDCGEGTYSNLQEGGYNFKDIKALFFTHLHIDHTADYSNIVIANLISPNEHLDIIGPTNTGKLYDVIKEVYADDIVYRMNNIARKNEKTVNENKVNTAVNVQELIGDNTINIDDIVITSAEMTHTIYTLAYRFDIEGKSIVISGDTEYDEDLIRLSKDADVLVIDGSSTGNKVNNNNTATDISHMSVEDMATIASKANIKVLVLTHYKTITQSDKERCLEEISKIFDGQVIFAEDMMEIGLVS
jgi:ribonuclease BN (tRNA processing enzyme)